MKTTIELTLDGFHGLVSHRVHADVHPMTGDPGQYAATIAPSAATKFRCRTKGCTCGERMRETVYLDQYDLDNGTAYVTGNYPSNL